MNDAHFKMLLQSVSAVSSKISLFDLVRF